VELVHGRQASFPLLMFRVQEDAMARGRESMRKVHRRVERHLRRSSNKHIYVLLLFCAALVVGSFVVAKILRFFRGIINLVR